MLSSCEEKVSPKDNDRYVSSTRGRSPKDTKWYNNVYEYKVNANLLMNVDQKGGFMMISVNLDLCCNKSINK